MRLSLAPFGQFCAENALKPVEYNSLSQTKTGGLKRGKRPLSSKIYHTTQSTQQKSNFYYKSEFKISVNNFILYIVCKNSSSSWVDRQATKR